VTTTTQPEELPAIGALDVMTFVAALALYAFFMLCKHVPALSHVAPFLEDPYDAVGSFTFQIAVGVSVLGLVRLHFMRRAGIRGRRRFVARGQLVVAVCLLLTVLVDGIAFLREASRAVVPLEIAILAAMLILALMGFAIAIAAIATMTTHGATPAGIASHANEMEQLFGRGAWSPQRHPLRWAALFALLLGLGVATSELFGDGPAPTLAKTVFVFFVFTLIEAAVTFAGTLIIGRWLGVLGPLRGDHGRARGAR
jgi:hypothetical protein